MRRLLLLLVVMAAVWSPAAKADPDNGFLLHFVFTPPYTPVGSLPTPAIDVCNDPYCASVFAIIQPKCLAKSDAEHAPVYFVDCAAYAFVTKDSTGIKPDINVSILSHPVTLRLRMDNVVSAPFPFQGGYPSRPLSEYVFAVKHSGMTLMVIPY